MPNCIKCWAELPPQAVYCPQCGRKQISERKTRTRGNGMGTAIKKGSGWVAIWTVRRELGEDGKVHYKRRWKSGFKTKTQALAYAANPNQETDEAPTVREYYELWEKTDYNDLSVSKQTAYDIAWKKLEPIADRRINTLSITNLQDAVDTKARTYYPAKDMKTLLSHLYKRAVAEGHVHTNLAEYIRLPPLNEKELQPFTEQELSALWKSYGEGNHFLGFVLLMIYSGMMPGELQSLKKDMIDYEALEIRGCGIKTKKRKDTPIVFPEMIAPVLRDLEARSDSRIGKVLCMNKDKFYESYHAALQAAGVRDLPPYSCRHTTATALALGNIAPSVIQEVMRHTKFATTQRYIHPDTQSSHAAVNTMTTGSKAPREQPEANAKA